VIAQQPAILPLSRCRIAGRVGRVRRTSSSGSSRSPRIIRGKRDIDLGPGNWLGSIEPSCRFPNWIPGRGGVHRGRRAEVAARQQFRAGPGAGGASGAPAPDGKGWSIGCCGRRAAGLSGEVHAGGVGERGTLTASWAGKGVVVASRLRCVRSRASTRQRRQAPGWFNGTGGVVQVALARPRANAPRLNTEHRSESASTTPPPKCVKGERPPRKKSV